MTRKRKTWLSIASTLLLLGGIIAPIAVLTLLKDPQSTAPAPAPQPPVVPEPEKPTPSPQPEPLPPTPAPPPAPVQKYDIRFNNVNSFPYGDISVPVTDSSIDENWIKQKVLEHKKDIFVFDPSTLPTNYSWEDNLSIELLSKQDTSLTFVATLTNANQNALTIKNTISFNNFKPNEVAPTYTVQLSDLKANYELIQNQNLTASITPAKPGAYYEWSCNDPDFKITQNNSATLSFNTKVLKSYQVLLKVYDSSSKTNTLATDNITINVNQMYGYPATKSADTFDFITTNQAVNLDTALANVKATLPKMLNQVSLKQYLDAWTQSYINDIVASRNNCVTGIITANTLSVNSDLTVSGEIQFKFTWIKDMLATVVPEKRNANDVEMHTYVFKNAPINPYLDYSVNNQIGFEIVANQFQRKLISTATNVDSYNVAFTNQRVLLNSMADLSITFNNSLFTIDPMNYLNTSYSYQRGTNDEKAFMKEVFHKLLHRQVKMLIAGDSPFAGGSDYITTPIIQVNLDRRYTISNDFLDTSAQDLFSLFYFINNSSRGLILQGNTLYIKLTGAVIHNVQPTSSKPLINLDTGNKYDKPYVGFLNLYNWFEDLPLIKKTLIDNVSSQITNPDWNAYVKSLSDTEKAEKIYAFLLPYVSYGQIQASAGNASGYVYKKLLCEGYAATFRYIASTLKITSLIVTGDVKANAKPGQTGTGKHAWNLIQNGSTWLWCDPTWDDSILAGSPTYTKDNFLKTTEQFFTSETHLNVDNWKHGSLLPIVVKPVK